VQKDLVREESRIRPAGRQELDVAAAYSTVSNRPRPRHSTHANTLLLKEAQRMPPARNLSGGAARQTPAMSPRVHFCDWLYAATCGIRPVGSQSL